VKEDGVFQGQMGPVQMRILMQPAHWSQVERHEKILRESLEQFESWYGPYPYKTITLVDPEGRIPPPVAWNIPRSSPARQQLVHARRTCICLS
jgi:hypothetical protein